MSIITILLFFIYTYGLGFGLTFFTKNSENFYERHLMRIGIGLGIMPILGTALNFLRIPLDWRIFLALSLMAPVYFIIRYKKFEMPNLKLTKSNLNIAVVILLFFITLYMYESGSFKYPYLEDDDPWHHAMSAKYVAMMKTAYVPEDTDVLSFLDPYPPGYAVVMGTLHQTSPSVSWTLKFFNALIISLAIIFCYFCLSEFMGNKNMALFSAFILTAIPCYLTHFIWAHALAVTLFFPILYCLERLKHDSRWAYPSIAVIGGLVVVQPSKTIKIGAMLFFYFLVKCIYNKKFMTGVFVSLAGGLSLSMLWWFARAKSFFISKVSTVNAPPSAEGASFLGNIMTTLTRALPPSEGTATRPYTFNDFFIAKPYGGINVQYGFGIFITILVLLALVYAVLRYKELLKKENDWIAIALIWLAFTFLGANSMTFNLPIGLFAFRFWLLLAIAAAIIAPLGLWLLIDFAKKAQIPKLIVVVPVVLGVLFTAGMQKYEHNTSAGWPGGATWAYMMDQNGRVSSPEMEGYLWLKTLPIDTKVFAFTVDRRTYIIGLDKFMCVWCKDDLEFQKTAINQTAEDIHKWLKEKQYEYAAIGAKEAMEYGINSTNTKINELISSGLFRPAHQTSGVVIFKVV